MLSRRGRRYLDDRPVVRVDRTLRTVVATSLCFGSPYAAALARGRANLCYGTPAHKPAPDQHVLHAGLIQQPEDTFWVERGQVRRVSRLTRFAARSHRLIR